MSVSTLTVIFTGVIAFATVAYCVATIFLWRATDKTAQAAKQSGDIAASLHRPYIGVTRFERTNDFNAVPGPRLDVNGMGSPFHRALRAYGTGNRCDLPSGGSQMYIIELLKNQNENPG